MQAVLNDPQNLTFTVANGTDENFQAVQLEVTIPLPPMFVLPTAEATHKRANLRDPPSPWGKQHYHLRGSLSLADITVGAPDIEAVAEKRALVRFPPIHVRPKSRHDAGSVVLALMPEMAGKQLPVTWRVTSISVRGDQTGTVVVAIAPTPGSEASDAAQANS